MYRVLELNPQLMPFAGDIEMRMEWYRNTKKRLVGGEGRLYDFANAHHYYGFHHDNRLSPTIRHFSGSKPGIRAMAASKYAFDGLLWPSS